MQASLGDAWLCTKDKNKALNLKISCKIFGLISDGRMYMDRLI